MIVGIPHTADFPVEPHSSYTVGCGDLTYGGLVDGPIYYDLFHERAGHSLTHEDYYAVFNNGRAVYHDDTGDYSSLQWMVLPALHSILLLCKVWVTSKSP